MTAQFLFIGDMHLGRRPTSPPEGVELDPGMLGPAAAWQIAVDEALARRVDAVILAGDAVDQDNQRYEALAPLQAGVQKLLAAGVSVLGVAGNHDARALPKLARHLPGFHLLGGGGRWEQVDLTHQGKPVAHLVGWSFPSPIVSESPWRSYSLDRPADGLPVLGVLHGDLDAAKSRYAPISRGDLLSLPVDAWLLGHVHRPSALEGPRPLGYLGSLVGLDPTETGVHGPWLLTLDEAGRLSLDHLPLAPLRWEQAALAVDGWTDVAALEDAVAEALSQMARAASAESPGVRAIGCRLTLRGRSALGPALRTAIDRVAFPRALPFGPTWAFVDTLTEEIRPAIDLERLAATPDPPGWLARALLALQADSPEGRALLAEGRRRLGEESGQRHWQPLEAGPPTEAETREILLRAGWRALEALLATRPERPEAGA